MMIDRIDDIRSRVSLDQWRALIAVVESGSFAEAARNLHRTQSTISHAIRELEERLAVEVFTTEGRRAVLTPAGQVLYRRARTLLREAARIEKAAAGLSQGHEAEIAIAVEMYFPMAPLLDCLRRFSERQPDTRIELHETMMSGADDLLTGGKIELAICPEPPPGFVGETILHVPFVAAAAPSHPLHRLDRPLTMGDLRDHRHLVVRDSGMRRARSGGVWPVAEQRLTVSTLKTSIQAACMGVGFAWYAEEQIAEELRSGALKPLPLQEGAVRWCTLLLVYRDPEAVSPGVRRLGEMLKAAVATAPVPSALPAHDGPVPA